MLANLLRQLLKPHLPPAASAGRELASAIQLQQGGDHAAAEIKLRAALSHQPGDVTALHLLGHCLVAQRRLDEAIEVLLRVTEIERNGAEAHFNLAGAYHARGDAGSALASFREAARLRPDFAEAYAGAAEILRHSGALDEAESEYRKSLAVKPGFAEAHYNLGNLMYHQGRPAEAVECYRRALAIDPHFALAHGNLLGALICDPATSAQEIYREHIAWAGRHAAPLARASAAHGNEIARERRLRIGYVSPDLWSHSVAYFFEPLLAQHDRTRFDVSCYYVGTAGDEMNARLRTLADHWWDCAQLSDEELDGRIRRDGIDILVDLAGHTRGNRLLLFARKPAPVQVTYLGYPTTTGIAAIDYRLTDNEIDPAGAEALNAEQPVRLPHGCFCYRPPLHSPGVGQLPARQAGHVTFGSFNAAYKLNESVLKLWAQILAAVPGAELMLKAKRLADAGLQQRLRSYFLRWGIAPERLMLQGWATQMDSHLALYNRVDIALDPFPVTGGTTTCESLWMGVPVVTIRGATHASRMGASLLAAVGLEELISNTPERYVETCVALASDLPRLAALRSGLRARLQGSMLMDETVFTRAVETEYRRAWRAWCERQDAGRP